MCRLIVVAPEGASECWPHSAIQTAASHPPPSDRQLFLPDTLPSEHRSCVRVEADVLGSLSLIVHRFYIHWNEELMRCVRVEADVLGSLSLIVITDSVDLKQHWNEALRAQELCESRGGRPGLPVADSPYCLCWWSSIEEDSTFPQHVLEAKLPAWCSGNQIETYFLQQAPTPSTGAEEGAGKRGLTRAPQSPCIATPRIAAESLGHRPPPWIATSPDCGQRWPICPLTVMWLHRLLATDTKFQSYSKTLQCPNSLVIQ